MLLSDNFDHSRVTVLRHAVASCAAAAGLAGDRLDDFVVAVNELMTNAVRHGGGAGRVTLWRDDDAVVCEVGDRGAGLAAPRPDRPGRPRAGAPGGWGLWLAGELTDSLRMETGAEGTNVRVSSSLA
jgi:anti-sigma regulatory factor (Ser/Thr protein kinase)